MQQPEVPVLEVNDWLKVFVPLAVAIYLIFYVLYLTRPKTYGGGKVFTVTNFWLILSGVIHSWIEMDFVFSRETSFIAKGLDLYAAADFRYSRPLESGTAAMEAITAILEGPLCVLVAFGAVSKASWRHPVQMVLCALQMYGLVWFTIHPLFTNEGYAGHFSADPVLFWVVAVGCNAPWGIVPPILFYQSFRHVCKACGTAAEGENKRKEK
mmetsp:Transcript_12821/g.17840  ORF Transcript_12821/g.17840 Transcript_12821/m.17840 type:complete len:211 (-) Transcript_12821:144-776(-)